MILMVDDEQWRNDSYLLELQFAGYDIHYERDVDLAWDWFAGHGPQIEAAILDIMMAPGGRYGANPTAQGGLRTGLLLYRDMRAAAPNLPVIFLTNVRFDLIAEELANERDVLVLRKLDYLPHTLPEQVESLLRQRNQEPGNIEGGE